MVNENEIMISPDCLITARPGIELQEEEDRWGILYNPGTDFSFGINPVSVFIWKQLKNPIAFSELVNRVKENCTDVPGEVEDHVSLFIKQLLKKELVAVDNA